MLAIPGQIAKQNWLNFLENPSGDLGVRQKIDFFKSNFFSSKLLIFFLNTLPLTKLGKKKVKKNMGCSFGVFFYNFINFKILKY